MPAGCGRLWVASTAHDPDVTVAAVCQQVLVARHQRVSKLPRPSRRECDRPDRQGARREGWLTATAPKAAVRQRHSRQLAETVEPDIGTARKRHFPLRRQHGDFPGAHRDTKSHSAGPCAFCNSLMAGSRSRSPFAIQSTAQVSSRKAGIVDYRTASQSSPTGEVRSVPG